MSSRNDHLTASACAAARQQPTCQPQPLCGVPRDDPTDPGVRSQPEQAFGAVNLGRLLHYLHSRQPSKPCRVRLSGDASTGRSLDGPDRAARRQSQRLDVRIPLFPNAQGVDVTIPDRPTLTVAETAGLLGISRWLVQQAVRNGSLPSRRVGRRILIPRMRLDAWLAGQDAAHEPAGQGNQAGDRSTSRRTASWAPVSGAGRLRHPGSSLPLWSITRQVAMRHYTPWRRRCTAWHGLRPLMLERTSLRRAASRSDLPPRAARRQPHPRELDRTLHRIDAWHRTGCADGTHRPDMPFDDDTDHSHRERAIHADLAGHESQFRRRPGRERAR